MGEKIIGISRDKKPLHPQRCETCRHFDPPEGMSEQGACTHELPNTTMAPVGPGQLANITYFPQMKPTQRCGKWEMCDPEDDPEDDHIPY